MNNLLDELQGLLKNGTYDQLLSEINKIERAGLLTPELILFKCNIYKNMGQFNIMRSYLVKNIESLTINKELGSSAAQMLEEIECYSEAIQFLLKILEPGDKKKLRKIKKLQNKVGKRKITLISTTYSGCNARALYYSLPEYISNKYDVKLVREQPYNQYDSSVINSDLIVTTHGNYVFKENQLNIDLWHGFPLKAMANMDPGDKRKTTEVGQLWDNVDYIISYSPLFNTVFNSCIGTSVNKYKILGSPRNDLLGSKLNEKTNNLLGFDFTKEKVIMFCPTFRTTVFNSKRNEGDKKYLNLFGIEGFSDEIFLDFLHKNNFYFLIKLHPVEEKLYKDTLNRYVSNRVKLITDELLEYNNIDLYNLLPEVDLLITDYSSIYFDYLLIDKPILFCDDDITEYRQNRGFLLEPYEYWTPGPKVSDQQQIHDEIIKLMNDDNYFKQERDHIKNLIHQFQDFNSGSRIWGFIDELLNINLPSNLEVDGELELTLERYKKELTKLVEKGDIETAIKIISEFENDFDEDNDLRCIYSTIYFLNGDLETARCYLEKSYFNDPSHLDTLYNLGLIFEEEGKDEPARFFYTQALEYCKEDSDLANELHDKLMKMHSVDSGCKVLVASPIYRDPKILQEFLISLEELDKSGLVVNYFFIDDNIDPISTHYLQEFQRKNESSFILKSHNESVYNTNSDTHIWKEELIWKVARFKDDMIRYAKINNYSYIFFIDSDLVLHPKTLLQLCAKRKDIISNIFWTKWSADSIELPQVWLKDNYSLYDSKRGENLTKEEQNERIRKFINRLREPGTYEVGGLGACTLISKKAIDSGVSFKEIHNVSFAGEDRHFCIRAVALGFSLFVDTHYPSFHIYRDEDLAFINDYKEKNKTIN